MANFDELRVLDRVALLNKLRALGVVHLQDRQKFANALAKAERENLLPPRAPVVACEFHGSAMRTVGGGMRGRQRCQFGRWPTAKLLTHARAPARTEIRARSATGDCQMAGHQNDWLHSEPNERRSDT